MFIFILFNGASEALAIDVRIVRSILNYTNIHKTEKYKIKTNIRSSTLPRPRDKPLPKKLSHSFPFLKMFPKFLPSFPGFLEFRPFSGWFHSLLEFKKLIEPVWKLVFEKYVSPILRTDKLLGRI